MSRKVKVLTTKHVDLSDLIPENWKCWFYDKLSQTSNFTWGDNNRSFITAERLFDECSSWDSWELKDEINMGAFKSWLKKIDRLGRMYVDLEN